MNLTNPARASAAPTTLSTTTMLDQAAAEKPAAVQAGRLFQPFVADTYSALRQPFLFSVTIRGSSRCRRKWRRAIWSTVSAAVIGRAAQQLCRLTLTKRLVRPPPQTATLGRRLRPCQRGWTDMTPGYNPSVICNPAALRGKMGSPRSNVQFR